MDALTNNHQSSSRLTEQYGGRAKDGGIETHIHLSDLGRGRVDAVVEHRQNEAPILENNRKWRDVEQTGNMRKMAEVPHLTVERWKTMYGFDLRRANLNDPEQYKLFQKLLNLNAQYKCWTGKTNSHFIIGV